MIAETTRQQSPTSNRLFRNEQVMNGFSSRLFTIAISGLLATAAITTEAQVRKTTSLPPLRKITIVSQPNTGVWIDGVLFGKTGSDGRLEIRAAPAGTHNIKFRSDGFRERSHVLLASATGEIKITLVKTTDEAELAFQEAERLAVIDREKAAETYRKAIKLRPDFPEAFVALARVLAENGDLEAAAKAAAAARKLRPGYAEASAVEGRIDKDNGDEEKAAAAFKRAIAEGNGFQPEALTGLGLLYKEKAEGFGGQGDLDRETTNYNESAKYLKLAVRQLSGAPDGIVVYQILGLVYERQRRFDEAIGVYEEFLRVYPESVEASAVRSFIEQIRKQTGKEN
jgi:hypothetical protein